MLKFKIWKIDFLFRRFSSLIRTVSAGTLKREKIFE